jgi:hypothetical protein
VEFSFCGHSLAALGLSEEAERPVRRLLQSLVSW